jgi:hypothetical protein
MGSLKSFVANKRRMETPLTCHEINFKRLKIIINPY